MLNASSSTFGVELHLVMWLCSLPLRLRLYSLPTLLQRMPTNRRAPSSPGEVERLTRIVVRLCDRRPFRNRLFPRACLRRSLALYRTLSRVGHPVRIHFGVTRQDGVLAGHSCVTVDGRLIPQTACSGSFMPVYSFPPESLSRARDPGSFPTQPER